MKILIVCQYFHPEQFRINDMTCELAKAGHQVSVLTGIPNYPSGRFFPGYGLRRKRDEDYFGVTVKRVPIIPRGQGRGFELAINYLSFAITGALAAMRVRKGDYDVVLVYQLSPVTMAIPGVVAAHRAKASLVQYVADLWPESLSAGGGVGNKIVLGLVGKVVDRIYRRCSSIWVTSEGFITPILNRGVPRRKLEYMPQYPESVYRPVSVCESDAIRREIPEGFIVVFTGNIGEAQGLEVAIEAAGFLSSFEAIHWVIIGDGRAREKILRMSEERGLSGKVLFLGKKPMEEIPLYLSLADIALLCLRPEPLFELTLPAKLQSYLACGMPIVGCIDGDAARVIRESGSGLVGPAGDARRLADNVLSLYRAGDGELKRRSGNALRYFEANFKKEIVINKIELGLAAAAARRSGDA